MSVSIQVEGIRDYERYVRALPNIATTAARIALNDTADDYVKNDFPDEMLREIAFPPGYLKDPSRLGVSRRATGADLQTDIFARERPTSLARFSQGAATFGRNQPKISVMVKPGKIEVFDHAFFVKLNAGVDNIDSYNVGLALRLKPGETLTGRRQGNDVPEIFPNVFLLYGPSVAQVFDDVADEFSEKISDDLASEFLRQFVRLSEEAN